jgi:hypothetical protein
MSVLGWVFRILQAALGVTFLSRGVVGVLGLPWHPTPVMPPNLISPRHHHLPPEFRSFP